MNIAKSRADAGDDPEVFPVTVLEAEDSRVFNIFIFKAIEEPTQFIGAIEAFLTATEKDHVIVHLSTPGGCMDSTDTFLNALKSCRAPVTFIATGGCHSAGTMILMHADDVHFSDGFNALVHCGSTGSGGTTAEYRAASKFNITLMEKALASCYKGFMTDDEIQSLLEGKDFWFNAEEFKERHAKRVAFLQQ